MIAVLNARPAVNLSATVGKRKCAEQRRRLVDRTYSTYNTHAPTLERDSVTYNELRGHPFMTSTHFQQN